MKKQASPRNAARKIYFPFRKEGISENGLADFYWPLSYEEQKDFGRGLEMDLAEFLANYPEQQAACAYKITMKNLVSVICGTFQGDLLRERALRDNVALHVPGDWEIWPHTLNKKAPGEAARMIAVLQKKDQKQNLLQKILHRANRFRRLYKKINLRGGGLQLDGLNVGRPGPDDFKNAVIATQRIDLIVRHARSTGEKVFLVPAGRWFSSITDQEKERESQNRDTFIEAGILKIVKNRYARHGLKLEKYALDYITGALTGMAALIRIHMRRLENRQDIPHTLWTGTGGNIWDLMLRYTVLERKGKVTGHDHGGGTGHANSYHIGWTELLACDRFITYSKKQADSFKKYAPTWPILDKKIPEISYIKEKKSSSPPIRENPKFLGKDAQIKTVFVTSTYYGADLGRGVPLYPTHPYIDWQARLIAKLRSWGYDVYFKPHPESRVPPPQEFSTKLGANILTGLFEDVDVKPDLLIFDMTHTSLFRPSFFTNTPIVIVDFTKLEWYADAFKLIDRRATVVDARFDKSNRIQVKWQDLKKAIAGAAAKANDHAFVKKYHM